MAGLTLAADNARPRGASVNTGQAQMSRVRAGPLAALGAVRYDLGGDVVCIIGRLPEPITRSRPALPQQRA
jgi:hypothetical protein